MDTWAPTHSHACSCVHTDTVHTHVYTHMHTDTCTHVHSDMHIHKHTCTCAHTYIYTHAHATCTYTHTITTKSQVNETIPMLLLLFLWDPNLKSFFLGPKCLAPSQVSHWTPPWVSATLALVSMGAWPSGPSFSDGVSQKGLCLSSSPGQLSYLGLVSSGVRHDHGCPLCDRKCLQPEWNCPLTLNVLLGWLQSSLHASCPFTSGPASFGDSEREGL